MSFDKTKACSDVVWNDFASHASFTWVTPSPSTITFSTSSITYTTENVPHTKDATLVTIFDLLEYGLSYPKC